MVRAAFVDSDGLTKGAWSREEDEKLNAYVQRYGHSKIWNWRLVPKYAGLERNGKSCRLRWVNYLRPGVKRGNFSKYEENLIIELHAELGNKWSIISSKLPGRTDNEIKNFWNGHIAKRPTSKSAPRTNNTHSNSDTTSRVDMLRAHEMITPPKTTQNESNSPNTTKSFENSMISFQSPSSSNHSYGESDGLDFWTDSFLLEPNNNIEHLPTFLEDEISLFDYGITDMSISDTSDLCSLDWIASIDHSTISFDHSIPFYATCQGIFPTEVVASNLDVGNSSYMFLEGSSGYYDPFFECFDNITTL